MVQMTLFNIPSTQTVEQPKTSNIKAETTEPMAESPKNLKMTEMKNGRKILKEILMAIDDETLKTEFEEFVLINEFEEDWYERTINESEMAMALVDNIADKPFIKKAVLNKIVKNQMTLKQVLTTYYKHLNEDVKELILFYI